MFYKTLAGLSLIVSVPAAANELDDLVNTSKALREQFANGIMVVGGVAHWAPMGGIASEDILANKDAYITAEKQLAYNQAVQAMKDATFNNMGAQEYYDQQAQAAMDDVNEAIDNYVDAATALIEVATLSNLAEQEQGAPDDSGALEVQNYIEANDVSVVLTDEEVTTYNQALDDVTDAAATAAAFYSIANDPEMISQANDNASQYAASFSEADNAYFDRAGGVVSVAFASHNMSVLLDVSGAYVQDIDIMQAGSESMFYYTSPEGGCWFAMDKQACLEEAGVYGSP